MKNLTLDTHRERRPLGEILVEQQLIAPEQLEEALAQQRHAPRRVRLGTVLIDRGFISRVDFMRALSRQLAIVKPYGAAA